MFLTLELVDILHGSLSLVFVVISLAIGIIILSKYRKFKSRLYLLVGFTWLGLATLWVPDSISLLMNLIFQVSLSKELYFIIDNVFVPIAFICWIIAFTDMVYREHQKIIVILTAILSIIFEIVFFSLFIIDIDLIGEFNPLRPFSADFGIVITVYLLIFILVMLVTGVIFAQKSIHLEDREVRLKGKLLRAAFITFTVAAVLEKTARSIMLGLVFDDPTDPVLSVMLVIVRVLLIMSAFEFYGGFLLPRWMKEIFLKSE